MDGPATRAGGGVRSPAGPSRADRWWCVGLFCAGAALRLAHVGTIRSSPFFSPLILDPLFYDRWAQRILAGEWIGAGPFFQDPLYAYLLAVIYAVAGHHYEPVLVLQALCGAAVAPLLLVAARPWMGQAAARTTAVLAAFYLPSVYYEGLILKTAPSVFLVAAALAALSRAYAGGAAASWSGAGVLLGLASLTRGNLVLVVPVLCAWLLLESRGRRFRHAVWLLAGCALVLFPAALHNRLTGGGWQLTENGGQNFYIGNNPYNVDGEYGRLPFVDPDPQHEEEDFVREAERRTRHPLSAGDVSDFWYAQAWAWIRGHPGAAARLCWLKLRNFWAAYEIPDNLDYYLYRETAPFLRLPIPAFGFVGPLALLGAVLAAAKPGWPRVLLLLLVTYMLSVVAFFVLARFRMPVLPVLFVFAGLGAVELARRLAAAVRAPRATPAALIVSAVLATAAWWVNVPVRAAATSPVYRAAAALGLPVRATRVGTAHFNLGVTYAAQAGRDPHDPLLARAADELRRALEDERFAQVYVELGKVLARQQRDAAAIAAYREAAALEPADARVRHSLGLLHRRQGDLVAAEAAFREALRLAPRDARSAVRLGEVLLAQGRDEEARAIFRRALALAPADAAALAGLDAAADR